MSSPSEAPGPSGRSRFHIPLSLRVILGVAIGIALGVTFRSQPILFGLGNDDLGPLGLLVIRLLKALATPLILFAVLDSFLKTKLTGASARRLLGTCLVNVTVAMVIGLTILNVFRPGDGVERPYRRTARPASRDRARRSRRCRKARSRRSIR